MSRWFLGATGAAVGAILVCNVAPWFVAKPVMATLPYLAAAKLQTIDKERRNFTEATRLSTLLPEMESRGVRLHAVVHEALGAQEFKEFLKGDIYKDVEKTFYGPQQRWMPILGIFSYETISRYLKAKEERAGNMVGEGRLLGAVYVIGAGDQGVIYQHHEQSIGDQVDIDKVKEAIMKVNKYSKL